MQIRLNAAASRVPSNVHVHITHTHRSHFIHSPMNLSYVLRKQGNCGLRRVEFQLSHVLITFGFLVQPSYISAISSMFIFVSLQVKCDEQPSDEKEK